MFSWTEEQEINYAKCKKRTCKNCTPETYGACKTIKNFYGPRVIQTKIKFTGNKEMVSVYGEHLEKQVSRNV